MKSRSILITARRSIVPEDCILHERDALSLYGMRNDAARVALFEGDMCKAILQLRNIMPVNLLHRPTKAAHFIRKWFEA